MRKVYLSNPCKKGEKPKRENPYTVHGADEDLFGGPSRALPKAHTDVHRPRVKIRGGAVTFAKHSPYKERVAIVNPAPPKRKAKTPLPLLRPLRIELSRAEAKELDKLDGHPSGKMVRAVLELAKKSRGGWDHVEVVRPGGAHAFDLAP